MYSGKKNFSVICFHQRFRKIFFCSIFNKWILLLTSFFLLHLNEFIKFYSYFLSQMPFNLKKEPKGQIVNNIILLSIMNENIFHFFIPFCELNIFPLYIQQKLSFTTTTSWGTEGRISCIFFFYKRTRYEDDFYYFYICTWYQDAELSQRHQKLF